MLCVLRYLSQITSCLSLFQFFLLWFFLSSVQFLVGQQLLPELFKTSIFCLLLEEKSPKDISNTILLHTKLLFQCWEDSDDFSSNHWKFRLYAAQESNWNLFWIWQVCKIQHLLPEIYNIASFLSPFWR